MSRSVTTPVRRTAAWVDRLRARRPGVDHLLRLQGHYSGVNGSQRAGAVTYFGFLSVFPLLALAVFFVGWVSRVYPDANRDLRTAVDSVLPGLIGNGEGQVPLSDLRTFSGLAGALGLLGVLYTGLGWISALREALEAVFVVPARRQPGFLVGKLRDLAALVCLGVVLLVSVAVAGAARAASGWLLGQLGLDDRLGWVVALASVAVGLAADALLLFLMFRLLAAESRVPGRSLWSGALLGAVLFELLKQGSQLLLALTREQPAFQAFGIALILLVWINYTSRLVLYAASWAYTSPAARAARLTEPAAPLQGPQTPPLLVPDAREQAAARSTGRVPAFVAGAAAALTAHLALRRRLDGHRTPRPPRPPETP